ncbi:hypothetical protein SteCoe_8426 [Stentor coeruleus]|uniref:Uncharacterized protein n=1 Tax=Stentor coeruleus TaxID=5963 RepID=A0A1R2CK99_9CILI|nr:hypothetical protein SteCoe_8426 [Stentor coeruleus]
MSIDSLSKQLPIGHILERRFSPYKKANNFIKHFEKHLSSKHQIDYDNTLVTLHSKFTHKTPEPEPKITSISPMAKLTRELQHKIEAINTYNNLSESKPIKRRTKRIKSQKPQSISKLESKKNKKNYFQMINQAYYEIGKRNVSLSGKINKDQEDMSRITKSFLSKKRLKAEGNEKDDSIRESEKRDFMITEISSPECCGVSYTEESPVKSYYSNAFNCKLKNCSGEWHGGKRMKNYPKAMRKNEDMKSLLSISPILDLNKCVGFF